MERKFAQFLLNKINRPDRKAYSHLILLLLLPIININHWDFPWMVMPKTVLADCNEWMARECVLSVAANMRLNRTELDDMRWEFIGQSNGESMDYYLNGLCERTNSKAQKPMGPNSYRIDIFGRARFVPITLQYYINIYI